MKNIFSSLLFCGLLLFSSCKAPVKSDYVTVSFKTQTKLETNVIRSQKLEKGSLVNEPTIVCPKDLDLNMKVSGWYKEDAYKHKWNFDVDRVYKDMTLYAKWVKMITVSYYLKGSSSPIWVVNNASYGEPLELHNELCDGYDFLGYYQDRECTIPFDLEKPLKADTDVYMYRGETLSLNAQSIKRRFTMNAAGGSGSTVGHISEVKVDPSGYECVDVNFGYSTSADPYMLLTNPQIDISKSQKIKIKFKNFGGSTSLSFYWVTQYADGSYAANVRVDSEANAAHYTLNGFECYMTEDDPWIEREFDLSNKFTNGVSTWGNSITLIRLRIQLGYISRNIYDESNVIRFASIKGISDDTNVGFKDSQVVASLLKNDSDSDIANASSAQTQNVGVIFPKNNSFITENSSTYYKKTNGLLLYSPYGGDISRYFFDVSNQNIAAADNTSIKLKLRNYSYITSLNLYIYTKVPGSNRTLSNVVNVPLSVKMNSVKTIKLNFFGKDNMVGIVQQISILFNYNGVDNAILIDSVSLSASKSYQIPGFNFDDPYCAKFVSNSNVSVAYNNSLKSSTFTTNINNAEITYNLGYSLDITPYAYLNLSYIKKTAGINSLVVKLKINDIWSSYQFDLASTSNDIVSQEVNLNSTGMIQSILLGFSGVGYIELKQIEFKLNQETSWDISNQDVYRTMLSDWAEPITYLVDQKAAIYNNPSLGVRYYFGNSLANGRRETGNICLDGKSKICLIYKNENSSGVPVLTAFAVDSNVVQDYETAINETSAIIRNRVFVIDNNMDEDSWKVAVIDIPTTYRRSNYYLSNFFLGCEDEASLEYYIRGIAII